MPIYQAFNRKIGAWVKYEFAPKQGFKPLDVKEIKPKVPFKHVQIKGQRPRIGKWSKIKEK